MKISDSMQAGFPESGSQPKSRTRTLGTVTAAEDFQSLSLPSMLELTQAGHPSRARFLEALSASLRAGIYTCDPDQVAQSILDRGLEGIPNE